MSSHIEEPAAAGAPAPKPTSQLSPQPTSPSNQRAAIYVLAKHEKWPEFVAFVQARSELLKKTLLRPVSEIKDVLDQERNKGAYIALDSLLFSVEGMVEAHEKETQRAQEAEFAGGH